MLDRDEAEEISGYRKVPPWGLGLVLLRLLTTQRENGPRDQPRTNPASEPSCGIKELGLLCSSNW